MKSCIVVELQETVGWYGIRKIYWLLLLLFGRVPTSATASDIKKAYYKLSLKQYVLLCSTLHLIFYTPIIHERSECGICTYTLYCSHPDKNPDPETKEKFQKIATAYEVLKLSTFCVFSAFVLWYAIIEGLCRAACSKYKFWICLNLGVCGQILKDEVKREQYDYAIAHPEEVSHFLSSGPDSDWICIGSR